MLNVKPLGYDLNKSVYWYFGNNKLYREDFENVCNLSTNLPVKDVSTVGFVIYFYYLYFIFKLSNKIDYCKTCMHNYIFR